MNHEAKLIFLRNLTARIREEHLRIIASPPSRTSAGFDTLMDKVDTWERQILQFEKVVKSDLHMAGLQTNWGRGRSYAARQSFQSRSSNTQTLRAAAADVTAAIAELLAALDPDSIAWRELIKSFEDMMSQAGEDMSLSPVEAHELQQIVEQAAPGSAPASPGAPGGAPVVGILTFALALFAILKKKRAKRDA